MSSSAAVRRAMTAFGVLHERRAGVREPDAAAEAREQRGADLRLELAM
jgi:hypothetical protein